MMKRLFFSEILDNLRILKKFGESFKSRKIQDERNIFVWLKRPNRGCSFGDFKNSASRVSIKTLLGRKYLTIVHALGIFFTRGVTVVQAFGTVVHGPIAASTMSEDLHKPIVTVIYTGFATVDGGSYR